jgi:hypothetical protein
VVGSAGKAALRLVWNKLRPGSWGLGLRRAIANQHLMF